MQVLIRIVNSRAIALDVEPADTIKSLKGKIQERIGIPQLHFWLTSGGKQLMDNNTISHYKITNCSTIHVLFRLLSCRAITTDKNQTINGGCKNVSNKKYYITGGECEIKHV